MNRGKVLTYGIPDGLCLVDGCVGVRALGLHHLLVLVHPIHESDFVIPLFYQPCFLLLAFLRGNGIRVDSTLCLDDLRFLQSILVLSLRLFVNFWDEIET